MRQLLRIRPRFPTFLFQNRVGSAICLSCRKRYIHRDGSKLRQQGSFFVSTPIFYVNAVPHIGHLYSAVIADCAHRWNKIIGASPTIYSTGTDEHGLKIQQAARNAGKDPLVFCDEVSQEFKRLFKKGNIHYTDFIRTTERRHQDSVQHFWECLSSKGYIYKGHYEGWYSTSDETFLTSSQLSEVQKEDGTVVKVSSESGHPVEWTTETNYMFKLSEFRQPLLDWLHSNPTAVHPKVFHKQVVADIEGGLEDLSISRQRSRLEWGIPVPNDPTQTIYVWLDALVNYLTVCGYPNKNLQAWPGYHIVGKDILKFHAVYWPAFLLAAGLPLPKSIVCHSHWTMDSMKMSKSKGNVVDPFEALRNYTPDGLRYFLLSEGVLHSDGDYREEKVINALNATLAGNLGNLLQRVTGYALNPNQEFPQCNRDLFLTDPQNSLHCRARELDYVLVDAVKSLPEKVDVHYQSFQAYKALDEIVACLRLTNQFIDRHAPWHLAKDPNETEWLNTILYVTMETLRVCSIALQPAIPSIADRILTRLGIPDDERGWSDFDCFRGLEEEVAPHKLGTIDGVIFDRLKEVPR